MSTEQVKEEVTSLREKSGGSISPQIIVDFAKDPSTALHSNFEWDDLIAAEEYRLKQASAFLSMHESRSEAGQI